jgi:hypothetical protein
MEKFKEGETINEADLTELVTLYKVIQNSITQKGKNPLQDTFISEKALPFLVKINSHSGLALLETQIELIKNINEKLDQAVSLTSHNDLVTDHNSLVDAHNLLQDEVNAYKSLTASLASSKGTIVDELNKANRRIAGLEAKDNSFNVKDIENLSQEHRGEALKHLGGVNLMTAALIAGGASITTAIGALFGFKWSFDKAVQDATAKASNTTATPEDSKKKKA